MIDAINKDFMIHLDMYIQGCEAEFYFNGVPLRRMCRGENFHSMNAHHLLVDGMNELEIVIFPGSSPSASRQPDTSNGESSDITAAKACLQLVKYPVDSYTGHARPDQLLMQINWEGSNVQPEKLVFPLVVNETRNLGSTFGQWLWQHCLPVNLEAELDTIHGVTEKLYNAFVSGDSRTVVAMSAPALKDIGRALPAYGEQAFARDMIEDIASNAHLAAKAKPFNTENVDFRLVGDGRLVQLINKDWEHTLIAPADNDGERYQFPAFLGKLNNQWFVVM